jgi:hypothetical protein
MRDMITGLEGVSLEFDRKGRIIGPQFGEVWEEGLGEGIVIEDEVVIYIMGAQPREREESKGQWAFRPTATDVSLFLSASTNTYASRAAGSVASAHGRVLPSSGCGCPSV